MRQRTNVIHVALHTGVTLKITVDILLRLIAANMQLLGKSKRRHTVDQTEIDCFGTAAHFRGYRIQTHTKYFRCGCPVYIETFFKSTQ